MLHTFQSSSRRLTGCFRSPQILRVTELSRLFLLLCIAAALGTGLIAWFSGPPEFDYLDGTEFAICGARMEVPHPPGYPLFISLLKVSSGILPTTKLDYNAFRIVTSFIAGAGVLAGTAALASFGAGPAAALLGSLLFFTLGPVMGQLNVLEVHGFAILLILIAIIARRSRIGPYLSSLSMFGGHPLSLLLLPMVWTRRFRERWVLLAAIPMSLWLFVPVRSTMPALSHYSHPDRVDIYFKYLTLYSGKFSLFTSRAIEAVVQDAGPVSIIVMLFFIVLSGRMRWRLFGAFAVSFLYLSVYAISDTNSMIWIALLPLAVWASAGIGRLVSRGGLMRAAAVLLVVLSAFTGVKGSWRSDDVSASVLSRDMIRGVGFEGIYISIGFITFHSAYLFEMLDLRPDILPMDTYQCFYRIPPPQILPAQLAGHWVYATRAWNQSALTMKGLLFTARQDSIDWEIYDVFRLDSPVYDIYARNDLSELFVRRAAQETNPAARDCYAGMACEWSTRVGDPSEINNIINRYLKGHDE